MIQWNELRITPDGKNLVIDVSISSQIYYENMRIENIVIDTQDTYVPIGPSEKAVEVYSFSQKYDRTFATPEEGNCNPVLVDEDNTPLCLTYNTEGYKHVRLIISADTLKVNLRKSLLFVYVRVSGIPEPECPCIWDKDLYMNTVCDLLPIYQDAMKYVKNFNEKCIPSVSFIDRILEYKAFTLAVNTGNYTLAIKYWKKFYESNKSDNTLNCECNGLY